MTPLDVALQAPYHTFYLLGIALAFWLAWRDGRQYALPHAEWLAVLAVTAAAGIVGSKLLHFDFVAASPGAKTILGGTLAGTIALLVATRALRLNPRAPDALALALPVGFAVGRLGCLLAGCCFGHVTDLPWGVEYAAGTQPFRTQVAAGLIEADAVASLAVHPTQLYEALLALMVAAAVARGRALLRAPRSALLATLTLLASGRLLLEFLRARDVAPVYGLTVVQWCLVCALGVCALVLARAEVRVRRRSTAAWPGCGSALVRRRPEAACRIHRAWAIEGIRAPHRLSVATLCMIAIPPVLLLAGDFFTPLERVALACLAVPPILAAIAGRSRTPNVFAPGLATAAIVMLPLQQDTTRNPRSYWTLGVGAAASQTVDDREVFLGYGEGCDGEQVARYAYPRIRLDQFAAGGTISRTQREAGRFNTVTLRGFMGRVRSRQIDSFEAVQLPEASTTLGAVAATTAWGGRRFGATIGGGVGRFGADSTSAFMVIAGVRVGSPESLQLNAGANDLEPLGPARGLWRVGLGYGIGALGSRLDAGAWVREGSLVNDEGFYLGGTLVTRSGFEIEPFLLLGGDHDLRIMLRRRILAR